MNILELKKLVDEIAEKNPDATIGLLTNDGRTFSAEDIGYITEQPDKHEFDYLIQYV